MATRFLVRCLLGLLALVAGCARSGPEVPDVAADDGAVTVASFNFPESVLLAELYAQALEAADVPVARRFGLGPREVVAPALEQGLVDVVPEYAGTALAYLDRDPTAAGPDLGRTVEGLARAYADLGVEVRPPASAQSSNGVVVTRATALAYDLATISDLTSVAGALSLGGPPECPQRPFCLPGLQREYQLRFGEFVPIDSGGRLTFAALEGGDVDVALLFTTDGHLAPPTDLVLLKDDRSLQPAENVVPVVRQDALAEHGAEVAERLDAVSAALTTDELVELNRQVSILARPTAEVASAWLDDQGLV